MPATPARIAKSTVDGVALSRVDPALRAANPDAVDEGSSEIEMFFDDPADADVLLDERWNWRKQIARPHEAVEVEETLGLGTTQAIVPTIPQFTIRDASRGIDAQVKARAFVADHRVDRYSVELVG